MAKAGTDCTKLRATRTERERERGFHCRRKRGKMESCFGGLNVGVWYSVKREKKSEKER